jgi:hypothetical protein
VGKKWLFWLCEGSAFWVGAKPNVPHVRLAKIVFKKMRVGKNKKNTGLAMSVGLLVVRLLYRFYVRVHVSKWFTFFSFLVVCSSLSGRLLHLLPTRLYTLLHYPLHQKHLNTHMFVALYFDGCVKDHRRDFLFFEYCVR